MIFTRVGSFPILANGGLDCSTKLNTEAKITLSPFQSEGGGSLIALKSGIQNPFTRFQTALEMRNSFSHQVSTNRKII